MRDAWVIWMAYRIAALRRYKSGCPLLTLLRGAPWEDTQ